MRPALTALVLVAVTGLAGCTAETSDPTAAPSGVVSSPTAPTETPTSTPSSAPSEAPAGDPEDFDDRGHEVLRGAIETRTPEQVAVADAWLGYWQVRVDAFHDAVVDPAALGAVATGGAADEVISYVDYLEQNDLSTVGDLRLGVDRVRVKAETATLRSCAINRATDRTPDGRPAESLTPFYTLVGDLVREGGEWRVAEVGVYSRSPC